MNKMIKSFWFFKSLELYEITQELKDILNLSQYSHDAEDTWEWCEAYDKRDEMYFDIYREHNNGLGKYECPVILIFNRVKNCKQSEIDVIGRIIAEKLEVEVFWGNVNWERLLENKYKPVYYYDVFSSYKI